MNGLVYEVSKGQKFQHYKGGIYTIMGMATHTENQEGLVIYMDVKNNVWARPVEMFFGMLPHGNRRFTPIKDGD